MTLGGSAVLVSRCQTGWSTSVGFGCTNAQACNCKDELGASCNMICSPAELTWVQLDDGHSMGGAAVDSAAFDTYSFESPIGPLFGVGRSL